MADVTERAMWDPRFWTGSHMDRTWNARPVWGEVGKGVVSGYTIVNQHVGQELQVSRDEEPLPSRDISLGAVP